MTKTSKDAKHEVVLSEREIIASAQRIIEEYGLKNASCYAEEKIAVYRARGDVVGARAWGRIRAALLDLADIRFDDDPIH